jgi:hypothetical protein
VCFSFDIIDLKLKGSNLRLTLNKDELRRTNRDVA